MSGEIFTVKKKKKKNWLILGLQAKLSETLGGPAPSEKASDQSEIWDLVSHIVLYNMTCVQNLFPKNRSTLPQHVAVSKHSASMYVALYVVSQHSATMSSILTLCYYVAVSQHSATLYVAL